MPAAASGSVHYIPKGLQNFSQLLKPEAFAQEQILSSSLSHFDIAIPPVPYIICGVIYGVKCFLEKAIHIIQFF